MNPLVAGAVVVFKLTAYSLGCDAPGPHTRAGTIPVAGHAIAADPSVLPIGSIVEIEGLGQRQVHDIGGGVKGRHVDVYFDTCAEADAFERKFLRVRVLHVPAVSSSKRAARVAPSASRSQAAEPAGYYLHRGSSTAQVPRRAPDSPGAGVGFDRPARGLAGQERGPSRPLVSQTSSQGRVVPAARNLSGDWRERERLSALLIGALVAVAFGLVVVICMVWFEASAWALACWRVGRWWQPAREFVAELREDFREARADWRERRARVGR